ncbi:MAG TPA: PilZ domain-containing protein [Candidatus Acidoferrum sp.]
MKRFVEQLTKDRRLSERHDIKTPVRVRLRKGMGPDRRGETRNISERGILLATDLSLQVGTMVDVLFKMPEAVSGKPTTEWLCTGHVVRIETQKDESYNGVGVQFDCYEVSRAS